MVDWITSQPFALAAVLLAWVACFRAQCTFWLGRAINAGILRTRWAERLRGERASKGLAALQKWGWPAIPVSFLTVGLQTAVNLSAGLIGWRWYRYTLAAIPGYLVWGLVYAAGGLAVWTAAVHLAGASIWLAVGAGVVLVGLIVVLIVLRRRRAARRADAESVPV